MTIGAYRHRVALDEPGDPISDPDGGWIETWHPLDPASWACSITAPTVRNVRMLEAIGGGSLMAQATHVITGRYHPGVTTQTRITFRGRVFNALHVSNVDERDITTEILAAEVIK